MNRNRYLEQYLRRRRKKQSLVISAIIHVIGIGLVFYLARPPTLESIPDSVHVDILPPPQRQIQPKKPKIERVTNTRADNARAVSAMAVKQPDQLPAARGALPIVTDTPRLEPPPLPTVTQLAPAPDSLLAEASVDTPNPQLGSGVGPEGAGLSKQGTGTGVAPAGRGKGQGGLGTSTGLGDGVSDEPALTTDSLIPSQREEIGDKLGSTIDEEGGIVRGHIRLIRLKHQLSDWWQDPTAIPSLIKWLLANQPTISADMDYMGARLN